MTVSLMLFGLVIALIFGFTLTNGFLDGGGIVSTVIMTRVLEPLPALLLVAGCEVVGIFLLGRAVVETMGVKMILFPAGVSSIHILSMLLSAMAGVLLWNMVMWRFAFPSSSSHALLGGILGATWVHFGSVAVAWPVVTRILIGLGVVPLAASLVSFFFARQLYRLGQYLTPAVGGFLRTVNVLVLAGVALVHGSNDGQKSMALVLLAWMAFGMVNAAHLPVWVALACGCTLGLGVLVGSRRTVRTVGQGFYRVQNLQGLCAESAAMFLVGASSVAGYPMATSHVMSSSVLGAGAAVRPRGIRWDLAGAIGISWLVTIPASAVIAGLLSYVVSKAF